MDYVADTHSLVWYFTDDSHLGEKALKAFEQDEGLERFEKPAKLPM
jgi:hypothetical protein